MLAAIPLSVNGQQPDGLVLSLSQRIAHDTNLLRLPPQADPAAIAGVSERSDTILRTLAGVSYGGTYGLQRVRALAQVEANRFNNYRRFNSEGYQLAGTWDWAVGTRWHGDAALRADQTLAPFVDVRVTQKNVVRRQTARLAANYRVAPRWSAVAGADFVRLRNSLGAFATADFDEVAGQAGARYDSEGGLAGSLLWRRAQGRSAGRFTGEAVAVTPQPRVDSDYVEDRLLAGMSIEPTGTSRVSAMVGYVRRDFASAALPDFGGPIYSLAYSWNRGGALSANAYAQRDIGTAPSALAQPGASQIVTANYTERRTYGVRPVWQLSAKFGLQGQLEYIERRVVGGAGVLPGFSVPQSDRLRVAGAAFSHEPMRSVVLTLQVRHERRTSPDARFNFSARIVFATLAVQF